MRFAVLVVVIASSACGFIPKGPTSKNNNNASGAQTVLTTGTASVTATDSNGAQTLTFSTLNGASETFIDPAGLASSFQVLFTDGSTSQIEVAGGGAGLKTGTFDTGGTAPGMGVNFDGPSFSYDSDDAARKCSVTLSAFADGNVAGTFTCPTDQGQSISGNWAASQ